MRKNLFLMVVVLILSAALAVAQSTAQSPSQSQSAPGSSQIPDTQQPPSQVPPSQNMGRQPDQRHKGHEAMVDDQTLETQVRDQLKSNPAFQKRASERE